MLLVKGVRIRKRVVQIPRHVAVVGVPIQRSASLGTKAPDLPLIDVYAHHSRPAPAIISDQIGSNSLKIGIPRCFPRRRSDPSNRRLLRSAAPEQSWSQDWLVQLQMQCHRKRETPRVVSANRVVGCRCNHHLHRVRVTAMHQRAAEGQQRLLVGRLTPASAKPLISRALFNA